MSGQGYDVAVVGAGLGGLTTAGLLARAGRSVILLERSQRAGGVCQDLEVDGYRFEVGTTFLSGFGPGGPLAMLCQRLGVSLPIQESEPVFQVALPHHRVSLWTQPESWRREVHREFPEEAAAWQALWVELEGLASERERAVKLLPPLPPEGRRERLRVWRALNLGMFSPISARTGAALRRALNTPIRATLDRHGLGETSRGVVEAILWYLLLRDPDECSTLEAAVALQQARRGVAAIPGGTGTLVEALREKFQGDGGQLRLETAVERLLLEGGRITGVVTAAGETIRARFVVADVAPEVLVGAILPPRPWWARRDHALAGSWKAARVAQAMVLAVPEILVPSELSTHCFIVRRSDRPAREENLAFVRSAPARDERQGAGALRCLSVARFVAAPARQEDAVVEGELLEMLDTIIPGVGGAAAFRRVLTTAALGEVWGRPSAAVRYIADTRDWLGQRGLPHRLGWPGLLLVGEWTYPGRLISGVADGAMRVADQILKTA